MQPAGRAGRLVAAADLPFTFERTLMPRPASDQAIITGLAFSINTAIAELVQESVQALAWLTLGPHGHRGGDPSRWNRATLGYDAGAMVAGLATQVLTAPRSRERQSRAG